MSMSIIERIEEALKPQINIQPFFLEEHYRLTKYEWRESLAPRERRVLLSDYKRGFLVFAFLHTNNPDVIVTVDLYGDGTDIVLSPRMLYEYGLVQPSPGSAWVSRYDTTNNVYVALYTPSPWIPFSGYARATVENTSDNPAFYTLVLWFLERR